MNIQENAFQFLSCARIHIDLFVQWASLAKPKATHRIISDSVLLGRSVKEYRRETFPH